MKVYGLIGYPLDHSWSKQYFRDKFTALKLKDYQYHLFPMKLAKDLVPLLKKNADIFGLNVTIPHKQSVLKYLNVLDAAASEIGAVNCIRIVRKDKEMVLMGYNTDAYGFERAILPLLKSHHTKAVILGTGGSARAVAWVFDKLAIEYIFVSRNPYDCNQVSYDFLTPENIKNYPLIINATPVGMFPNINNLPPIPYTALTKDHLLFDLIYNPIETQFLKEGKKVGTQTSNGLKMLQFQADKTWELWNP